MIWKLNGQQDRHLIHRLRLSRNFGCNHNSVSHNSNFNHILNHSYIDHSSNYSHNSNRCSNHINHSFNHILIMQFGRPIFPPHRAVTITPGALSILYC